MHDEFERAMTGRPAKRGLSPFGWVLAGAGLLATVGVLGAGFVAYQVAHSVRHEVTRALGVSPKIAMANMAARLAQVPEVVSMDPDQGLALLNKMDRGDFRGDFLRTFVGADFRMPDGSAHPDAPEAPAVPVTPGTPDVSVDAGSVHVHSGDDNVSIALHRSDNGGFLTIDSDHGKVRFDLSGTENGGHLSISTENGETEVTVGRDAGAEPDWVDGLYAVPSSAEPVISLSADGAQLGAVAWQDDDAPGNVLVRAQSALEDEGYDVRVREPFRQDNAEHASLWARNEADGRMVFVIARRDHGRTGILLGYGEKR